jgi:hypothetical protein
MNRYREGNMIMINAHRYDVLEFVLHSKIDHPRPDRDLAIVSDFTGPSGQTASIAAFWDGGRTWRVRFSPEKIGRWTWRTRCLSGHAPGLAGESGEFECIEYRGVNPLYRHGPLMLSPSRRSLAHADGTPFFWLADTAWNGVIRGDDNKWQEYLATRAGQRFNVIQFVASHWRGDALDEAAQPSFYEDGDSIRINPCFFQRLDRRVAMINQVGCVAAPVVLWSLLKTDPGYRLKEEDATRMASYIVSRYDAYQVVWLLGGDGNYQEIGVDRWKRMGRSVFRCGHDRLVTLHPCGQNWVGEDFREEEWYDIIAYQSGHGDGEEHLRWLVEGPPATAWDATPTLPTINMEPNYETAIGYQNHTVFTDYHVRRAAYWSLLASPPAGVTYGHDSIWNWNSETGPSEGHGNWHDGAVPPWHTGLETTGTRSMTVLRGIFEKIDWTTLTPCRFLLAEESRRGDAAAFIAVGRTAGNTVVVYSPRGGTVCLGSDAVPGPLHIVDPRTGKTIQRFDNVEKRIDFPDAQDWLAVCGHEWNHGEKNTEDCADSRSAPSITDVREDVERAAPQKTERPHVDQR